MNNQEINSTPTIKKESKNKIRVDFERSPLKERLKTKFLSLFFVKKVVWYLFRLILLIGIAYIVLYPFITKIAGSFMSPEDFVDATVRLIPRNFTFDTYIAIFNELNYVEAFINTFMLSASTALIQTFVCCMVGYGLAKFKFKGRKIVFLAVIFSLIVPHRTLQFAMFRLFSQFDLFGIFSFLSGNAHTGIGWIDGILQSIHILPIEGGSLNLLNTFWPLIILSISGLAFKNGLYIFLLRQFFNGVPDELEESAYIDGSGTLKTFISIILPLSIPMMITVFLFAFCWQWTDNFYVSTFFTDSGPTVMTSIVNIPPSLKTSYAGQNIYYSAIRNTAGLMIIAPLIVLYLFCQKFLVQGIERSGIVG